MRHAIVGNGPAGVIAAETLRSQRSQDEIVLVGDEPEPPYSRMAIPYLLEGGIGEPGTYLRKGKDHFAELRITLRHASAQRVDTQARSVELSDGSKLTYDTLLLATGSAPVEPPIPGIRSAGVFNCWTLADARKIASSVQAGTRVLQLGAGFIGCIIMESIVARGAKLTVIEMGDRVVPRMMPPGAAALIKRWCETKGVRVLTGAKATRIDRPTGKEGGFLRSLFQFGVKSRADVGALRVQLDNGETLEVDVVISATGVRPKIGFLAGSGIAMNVGILIDDHMRTNIPEVFAAGDCVEAAEFGTGARFVNAIQPNAADQARVAALNMAGRPTRSQGAMALNVLDTFGLISASFGQWQGVKGGDSTELIDKDAFRYLRLEFEDDVLVGATAVGLTEHVGVIRGLIQSRTKLGRWKAHLMRDPTQIMSAYLARAQAAA